MTRTHRDWLVEVSSLLDYLVDVQLRDEIELDFSADSLEQVERFVLSAYDAVDELAEDEEGEALVESVAAYVGETMLRLAGGGWRVAAGAAPAIEADAALGLARVSPTDLVLAAVREHTGGVFRGAYDDWDRAVRAHREAHPSWTPEKELTPGVDPVPVERSDVDHLAAWLAEREEAFATWAARYGGGIVWDFSAESLDALGALVLRVTPTVADLRDPANREFVDGAAWYLGETLRRARDGQWLFRAGDPELSLFLGKPYVERLDQGRASAVPHVSLEALVEERDPHQLLGRYLAFTG